VDNPGEVVGDVDETGLDGEEGFGHVEDEEDAEEDEVEEAEDASPVAPGEGEGVGQHVREHSAQLTKKKERPKVLIEAFLLLPVALRVDPWSALAVDSGQARLVGRVGQVQVHIR